MGDDGRYQHPPQFAGRYLGCVLDYAGNCSRWNHDHPPAEAVPPPDSGAAPWTSSPCTCPTEDAATLAALDRLRTERDEHQWNALEMARKADQAERRAEEAEFHVEQLRDARDSAERIEARAVELATERDAALARIARTNRLLDAWEHDRPDDPAIHRLIRRVREAFNSSPSVEQAHIEMCGSVTLADGRKVPGCWLEPARGDDGDMNDECPGCECGEHQWLERPESDARECLTCGTEVAG